MASEPNLPPLSLGDGNIKRRKSRSVHYDNSSPEIWWKLTGILPHLWVRDGWKLEGRTDITQEMDAAWMLYQKLGIPGKGDGKHAWSVAKRQKLKDEYSKLEPEVRRAKEIALARHDYFCIRGTDGSLDYHVDVKDKRKEEEENKKKKKCVHM
jgi:hypothetical protein